MAFQLSAVASVPIMAVGYQRSAMELKVDTVIMRGPLRRGGPLQNRKPQRLMYYQVARSCQWLTTLLDDVFEPFFLPLSIARHSMRDFACLTLLQGSCLQPQRLCPSCSRSQLDEAVEDQKQETASKQHSSKLPGAAQDTWIDEQDSGCSGVDGSFKGRSLSVDGSRRPSFQPGMEGAFTVRGKLFTHRVQVWCTRSCSPLRNALTLDVHQSCPMTQPLAMPPLLSFSISLLPYTDPGVPSMTESSWASTGRPWGWV